MLRRRSVSVLNARLMDVLHLLRIKEFALDMVRPGKRRLAAMKDVQILLGKEVFVFVMVPRGRLAAMKDALALPKRGESA